MGKGRTLTGLARLKWSDGTARREEGMAEVATSSVGQGGKGKGKGSWREFDNSVM